MILSWLRSVADAAWGESPARWVDTTLQREWLWTPILATASWRAFATNIAPKVAVDAAFKFERERAT